MLEKCGAVSGGRTECALANVSDDIAVQGCSQLFVHSANAVLSELTREKLDIQTGPRHEGGMPYGFRANGYGGRFLSGTNFNRRQYDHWI